MEEKKRASLIGFNQDSSTYLISGKRGHKIFTLDHVNGNVELIYDGNERVFMLDRLFSSSLSVFVPFSKPRSVHLRHLIQDTIILNTSISNSIVNVKLNRKKLVACTTDSIVIYDITEMVQGHAIFGISHNEKGVFTMNSSPEVNDQCLLAYPASTTRGDVQIFDAITYTSKLSISAHTNPLGALAFDAAGKLLATTSTSGTVIKVFQVVTGLTLFELRRGVARSVTITSLTFSNCAQYLCSSSNTETVHVFKLNSVDKVQKQDSSWFGYLSSAFTAFSSNMLPSSVSSVFTQDRSFATAYLPVAGIKNVSTVVNMNKQLRLYVGTENSLFIYDIDETGETFLYKKHNLYEIKLSKRIIELAKLCTKGKKGSCNKHIEKKDTKAFKEIITDSMIEM